MKIKCIVWRQLIFGQIRRLTLGINVSNEYKDVQKNFYKLRADHALEWGNNNKNPGVWIAITNKDEIPLTPDSFKIKLNNSENILKLWQGNNNKRGNKIKISQRIWEEKEDIIEVWYLGMIKLLKNLLENYLIKNPNSIDAKILLDFIVKQLLKYNEDTSNLSTWAKDTQDAFKTITLNPSFLFDSFFIREQKIFIQNNYLALICYEKNGMEIIDAIMFDVLKNPKLQSIVIKSVGYKIDFDTSD